MLAKAYKSVIVIFPELINSKFSNANAEKVVYPPQNPTTKSMRKSVPEFSDFKKYPARIPIKKQPEMFTKNVPKGNSPFQNFLV